jgi:hypothetical protein
VGCSGFACLSVGLAMVCNPLDFSVSLILLLVFVLVFWTYSEPFMRILAP